MRDFMASKASIANAITPSKISRPIQVHLDGSIFEATFAAASSAKNSQYHPVAKSSPKLIEKKSTGTVQTMPAPIRHASGTISGAILPSRRSEAPPASTMARKAEKDDKAKSWYLPRKNASSKTAKMPQRIARCSKGGAKGSIGEA